MTPFEKLAAILAAVQVDPGNRGLANLFHHFPHDFENACRSIAEQPDAACLIHTGFYIPSGTPPAFETDGPLGAVFLIRVLHHLGLGSLVHGENDVQSSIIAGLSHLDRPLGRPPWSGLTHMVAIERSGPAADSRHYNMRGVDISPHVRLNLNDAIPLSVRTIGIGDGGNEIGMGKLPHQLIAANIPNGDLIHCHTAADHLIVAGVSNWGAYALAAGIMVLRGVKPPAGLFDPDRERAVLEAMVQAGPLVDGVTGKPTATVDGLTWDEYMKPFLRIGEILEAT